MATFEEFENAALSGGRASERRLCDKYLLSYDTLCEYRELRRSFVQQLTSAGLVADKRPEKNGNEAEGRPLAGGAECNRHRANRNLVAAVLAAGLYPNLATTASSPVSTAALFAGIVPASAGDASFGGGGSGGGSALEWFCGRRGGRAGGEGGNREVVRLHRDSVNYGRPATTSRYLTFFEKRKTGGHSEEQQRRQPPTLHESSAVSPVAIVMFCNNGDVSVRHRESLVTVDGWLNLAVPPKTAVLLRGLRRQLEVELREVARAPLEARAKPSHRKIIDTVASILATERVQAAPLPPESSTKC